MLTPQVRALLALSEDLQRQPTLDAVLQRLVDGIAELLGTEHVSIRLLDATRTLLLTHARAGDPFHQNKNFEFVMGEGLVGWVAKTGQRLRLGDAESDSRFRARPDQTKAIKSFIAVPILEQGVCIGVVSAASERCDEFGEDHEELLALATAVCGPHVRTVRVSRLANPDPLTGVIDPRRLDEAYPDIDGLVVADPLSVLLLDVDGLDKQRERFGRGFAEDLLKSVAELLANDVRRGDPVIRHGPHAFLVLLPGVPLATASRIAERIRRAIEGDMILSRPDLAKLTVSIGIAERARNERRDAFLARAAAALEAARCRGGNRVEYA